MVKVKQADVQRNIDEFVSMLKTKAGDNLLCVMLYGSAATQEFSPEFSDVNILCVFEKLQSGDLVNIAPAMQWWERFGRAALVLTLEELTRSADVFAIEMLDIKANHKLLHGRDVVATIDVPLDLHRIQVERELRTSLIRLRQKFLSSRHDRRALVQLLVSSSSTFNTLLRHVLIVMGHGAPKERKEVAKSIERVLQADMSAVHTVLDIREGKIAERDVNVDEVFSGYLSALSLIVDKVDRQLST